MSDAPIPKPPRKKESTRGIVIVAILCASFLWWWFTLDVTPEDVGPSGLLTRAMEEIPPGTPRPLVLDFDLQELAMCWLRAGKPAEAISVAEKIHDPLLQARSLRAVAQSYVGILASDTASMGPALKTLDKIRDPEHARKAREIILLELVRQGFPDVAWEHSPSPQLQVKLIRVMAETDARVTAAKKLAALEPSLPANLEPDSLLQITMAHLWLGHRDRVLELVQKLSPDRQDEIYLELFRMVRLETPDQAKALLAKFPAHVQQICRLEAARLNGTIDTPDDFVSELTQRATNPTATPEDWMFLTKAQWQLLKPDPDAWKQSSAKAESLLANSKDSQQINALLRLSQIHYDALDIANGHRLLETARKLAIKPTEPAQRLVRLSPVLEAAFRNAEAEYFQHLLVDLTPDLLAEQVLPNWTDAPSLQRIVQALFREGNWTLVMDILSKLPVPMKTKALEVLADLPVESTASHLSGISQDKSLTNIRQTATNHGETEAAKLATKLPSQQQRARAWLEMAKALILKSVAESTPKSPGP